MGNRRIAVGTRGECITILPRAGGEIRSLIMDSPSLFDHLREEPAQSSAR